MNGLRRAAALLFSVSFGLAACSKPSAPPDDVASASSVAEAPAPPAPPPPSMQVDSGGSFAAGDGWVRVKNTDQNVFLLNKLVVNGQAGDVGCDIKVFKSLAPGGSAEINVPHCGDILSVEISTDRGNFTQTFGSLSISIVSTDDGATAVKFYNKGAKPTIIQKFIANDQPDDENCNIKVFKSIEPDGNLVVPVPNCGDIHKLLLTSDNQPSTINFR